MIHMALIVIGVVVVASWSVLYARNEGYWWGLILGMLIAFAGVIASGGRKP